ncbi:PREDICTED: GTP-binding protein At3g49725, chloroplastic-like [Camelina sativa]|uniref:GTP-binding protein At3g49725, chloroplastic-like n=1 Tax=Camelina sativa TaxID=90675 RepID=A0ABM0THH0_CAMSA|nr:PREDICTED: GTP-binding protein At3g49725, chloroplastic-like [Camelina sativa]
MSSATSVALCLNHLNFGGQASFLYKNTKIPLWNRQKLSNRTSMLRTLSHARDRLRSVTTSSPLARNHLRSKTPPLSSPFSSKRHAPKTTSEVEEDSRSKDSVLLYPKDPSSAPKLFLVQPRLTPPKFLQAKLNEALCLANSLEEQRYGYFESDFFEKELPSHVVVQNPVRRSSKPRADTYFGPGTVDNIKCHLNAEDSKEEVDAVFVNAMLTAIQQRNLERIWEKPVLDRVGLIIEIFNAHAHTKEAKLQAELAALMYKKSRLVRVRGTDGRHSFGQFGEAEVVSARGRAASGTGGGFVGGAGETELQLQRRRIADRRLRLLSQIKEAQRTRLLQRARRQKRAGRKYESAATIAVVGYTNAGKSTLTSALTKSALYCNERLFATLDPSLRSVYLPCGEFVHLSDTVGFISDLPIQLVEAFRSTLEEVVEADILIHVVDSTAPNIEEHRATVFHVLKQIGVSEEKLQNMIEVWNKIDYEVEDEKFLDDGEGEGEEEEAELNDGLKAEETVDEDEIKNQDDDPDGWLLCEDENVSESAEVWKVPEVGKLDAAEKKGPHVRVSALTGAGLKELIYLINEKVNVLIKKRLDHHTIVESSSEVHNRKWRPPREDEEEDARLLPLDQR